LRLRPLAILLLLAPLGCATLEPLSLAFPEAAAAPLPTPFETDEPDLPPVEGLTLTSGELRSIPLRWRPLLAGDVAGYLVERAPAAEGDYAPIAVLRDRFSTAYEDRGGAPEDDLAALPDGALFRYRVRAFDGEGQLGAESTPVEGQPAPLPPPPEGVQAFSQLPRRVALAWEPSRVRHVTGYVITRSPSALGGFMPVAETVGRYNTTWADEGLGDLRVFYYRVASVSPAGESGEPSEAKQAVTKPAPLPPMGVAVLERELGRNVVAWEPNVEKDLAGYRVFRVRTDEEVAEELVAEVPQETREVVDSGVGAGEEVTYSVRAFDRDGLVSAGSDSVQVASVSYGLRARAETERAVLDWSEELQGSLTEMRVLRVGRIRDQEVARTDQPHFEEAIPDGGTLRYRLVGVRPDGSEAPPSSIVEVEVPPPAAR
jgi:hypothetical protein